MSMGSGMGPVWRHMRTDRSIGDQKLGHDTVRRVFGFARPHRRPIGLFLVLTVLDAALVVVTPLLVKRIVDDGILKDDSALVVSGSRWPSPVWRSSTPGSRWRWAGCPRGSARG